MPRPKLLDHLPAHFQNPRLLGKGSMGVVYRVFDTRRDQEVACKLVHPLIARTPLGVARFLRETRALAALDHPNVIRLLDFARDPWPHYVMPLVEGDTLRERLDWGPLPREAWLEVARPLLQALDHCHAQGVLHRDIKPDNILLPDDAPLTLLDFGMARDEESDSFTQGGVALGTPLYMPPEQMIAGNVDATGDLYSAALTLHEAFTGALPFARDQPHRKHDGLEVSPAAFGGGPAGAALAAAFQRALEPLSTKRFSRAGDLLAALEAALSPR